jgi:hypothetical protein
VLDLHIYKFKNQCRQGAYSKLMSRWETNGDSKAINYWSNLILDKTSVNITQTSTQCPSNWVAPDQSNEPSIQYSHY